jgi:hypothetical protein
MFLLPTAKTLLIRVYMKQGSENSRRQTLNVRKLSYNRGFSHLRKDMSEKGVCLHEKRREALRHHITLASMRHNQ